MSDLEAVAAQTGQVFYQGRLFERERIIKLLEARTNGSGSVLDETGNSIADLSDLIALIKGESK